MEKKITGKTAAINYINIVANFAAGDLISQEDIARVDATESVIKNLPPAEQEVAAGYMRYIQWINQVVLEKETKEANLKLGALLLVAKSQLLAQYVEQGDARRIKAMAKNRLYAQIKTDAQNGYEWLQAYNHILEVASNAIKADFLPMRSQLLPLAAELAEMQNYILTKIRQKHTTDDIISAADLLQLTLTPLEYTARQDKLAAQRCKEFKPFAVMEIYTNTGMQNY